MKLHAVFPFSSTPWLCAFTLSIVYVSVTYLTFPLERSHYVFDFKENIILGQKPWFPFIFLYDASDLYWWEEQGRI